MASKRILVTGGAGYVGSILARNLLKAGYGVRVLDNFLYSQKSLEEIQGHERLELVNGNITDFNIVEKTLEGIESVVHLAAIVGDAACNMQADLAVRVNYSATMNLARQAKKRGINKLVFASTCSNYGQNEEVLTEDSPLNPVSLYAMTKVTSEKELLEMEDETFHPCILRLATLYGLSPRMRFDLVVNYFSMKASVEKEISVFGGGQWRPFLHVADAARAVQTCVEAPNEKLSKKVFNCGCDKENYTIKQLAELVAEKISGTKIDYVKEIKDQRTYRVDFTRVKKELGFEITKTVPQGIEEIKKEMEENKIKNPKDRVYYNYLP
ncbi:NAD(P)-dependent oxidoreductase [Candidatus Micrarchaeota archaeon]|nr:NAD(P)-dependent oxidoreductase [Candidatus Micrarchaeota archaeon]